MTWFAYGVSVLRGVLTCCDVNATPSSCWRLRGNASPWATGVVVPCVVCDGTTSKREELSVKFDVTGACADGTRVVSVTGDVDVYTSPVLRKTLMTLIDQGHDRLIVNLQHVAYIDSTGLGVLIGAHRRLRAASGSIRLASLNPHITKLFEIAGLVKIFELFEDERSALALKP